MFFKLFPYFIVFLIFMFFLYKAYGDVYVKEAFVYDLQGTMLVSAQVESKHYVMRFHLNAENYYMYELDSDIKYPPRIPKICDVSSSIFTEILDALSEREFFYCYDRLIIASFATLFVLKGSSFLNESLELRACEVFNTEILLTLSNEFFIKDKEVQKVVKTLKLAFTNFDQADVTICSLDDEHLAVIYHYYKVRLSRLPKAYEGKRLRQDRISPGLVDIEEEQEQEDQSNDMPIFFEVEAEPKKKKKCVIQ